MARVGHVVGVGGIEDMAVESLVHRPVEHKALLAAIQHTVNIAILLGVTECMVPYAHLGKVAMESLIGGYGSAATYGEIREAIEVLSLQCHGRITIHLHDQLVACFADG